MECLITLDDAVTALYAQLNAPSRRFAALISSWFNFASRGWESVTHSRETAIDGTATQPWCAKVWEWRLRLVHLTRTRWPVAILRNLTAVTEPKPVPHIKCFGFVLGKVYSHFSSQDTWLREPQWHKLAVVWLLVPHWQILLLRGSRAYDPCAMIWRSESICHVALATIQ